MDIEKRCCLNCFFTGVKRGRGRPRRYPPAGQNNLPTQIPAVIIPTSNGQTLMMAPVQVSNVFFLNYIQLVVTLLSWPCCSVTCYCCVKSSEGNYFWVQVQTVDENTHLEIVKQQDKYNVERDALFLKLETLLGWTVSKHMELQIQMNVAMSLTVSPFLTGSAQIVFLLCSKITLSSCSVVFDQSQTKLKSDNKKKFVIHRGPSFYWFSNETFTTQILTNTKFN